MLKPLNIGLFLILSAIVPAFAQRSVTVSGVSGRTHNQTVLASARAKTVTAQSNARKVVVFSGDRVIPQVVDGDYWKTTFILNNLEATPKHVQVLFFNDDGTDMFLPIRGGTVPEGEYSSLDLMINPAGTVFFETAGTDPVLLQGWALLKKDNSTDSVGGMAVFQVRSVSSPQSEAAVPFVSQFDDHFILIFDNTQGFDTGMAIANPTTSDIVANAIIYDEIGNVVDQRTIVLGPYEHQAFSIRDHWPITENRRGSVEFQTNGFGIGVLGLRFSPYGSFTSFNVLTNFEWVVTGN